MALPRSDGKRHNGARRTALLYALAALVWFIIGIGFVQILATDPLTGLIGATLLGVVTTAAVYFYASRRRAAPDRKSTRLNSSHVAISYAVFCLKKKNSER